MKHTFLFCLLIAAVSLSAETNTVKIEADKTSGCTPLSVHFSGVATETDATWMWDFGNGNTSKEKSPVVYFLKPGLYEVTLVVTGKSGIQSTTKMIKVNEAPKADFTIDKNRACANEVLNFTNLSASSEAAITNYVW